MHAEEKNRWSLSSFVAFLCLLLCCIGEGLKALAALCVICCFSSFVLVFSLFMFKHTLLDSSVSACSHQLFSIHFLPPGSSFSLSLTSCVWLLQQRYRENEVLNIVLTRCLFSSIFVCSDLAVYTAYAFAGRRNPAAAA